MLISPTSFPSLPLPLPPASGVVAIVFLAFLLGLLDRPSLPSSAFFIPINELDIADGGRARGFDGGGMASEADEADRPIVCCLEVVGRRDMACIAWERRETGGDGPTRFKSKDRRVEELLTRREYLGHSARWRLPASSEPVGPAPVDGEAKPY